MLFYIIDFLKQWVSPPGIGVFQYTSFRAAAAAITALLISFLVGPKIIGILKRRQIGEQAKKELQSTGKHSLKAGTPTMGGFIVLASLIIPTLLWADVSSAYIILVVVVTLWLGAVGFLDDYLKVVKKYPNGLIGRYKLLGQIIIGLVLGGVIYFFPELFSDNYDAVNTLTTLPFNKNIYPDLGIFYIPVVVFVLTATSNAVNLTDGLDGLSIGTVGITALALAIITYVSGDAELSKYLNILHLRGANELTVFCAALVGAALGFLWYNSHPAQIFIGDTGALALGGSVAALCILVKQEFLLPILGGLFFAETLSVIIQVAYFKYTRKRTGTGKRIFKMAPIHHHFEKSGLHETKIVTRFYIIAVLLAIVAVATLKLR